MQEVLVADTRKLRTLWPCGFFVKRKGMPHAPAGDSWQKGRQEMGMVVWGNGEGIDSNSSGRVPCSDDTGKNGGPQRFLLNRYLFATLNRPTPKSSTKSIVGRRANNARVHSAGRTGVLGPVKHSSRARGNAEISPVSLMLGPCFLRAWECSRGGRQADGVVLSRPSAEQGLVGLAQDLSDGLAGSGIFSPPSTEGLWDSS